MRINNDNLLLLFYLFDYDYDIQHNHDWSIAARHYDDDLRWPGPALPWGVPLSSKRPESRQLAWGAWKVDHRRIFPTKHPSSIKKRGNKKGDSNGYLRMKKLKNEWCKDYLYIYIRMYIHPLRPLTFRDSHDAMESARGPRLIQVPMKAEDWCRGTLQCHETWLAGEMGTALERYHWKIWKINYSSIAYIEMKLSRWEKSSNCGLSIAILDCGSGCFFRFVDVTSWFKSLVSSLLRLMAETQRLR